MRQLIGLTLVLALTLAVMVIPAAAQELIKMIPISIVQSNRSDGSSSVIAVPNFISYRDRSRTALSESDDMAEFADDNDLMGVTSATPNDQAQWRWLRAYPTRPACLYVM
jgi:hypothetical protein